MRCESAAKLVIVLSWLMTCISFGQIPRSDPVVEVVPSARQAEVSWRYTFSQPEGNAWTRANFDDSGWNFGRAAFGTLGTPGVVANTRWASSDIWMRRRVEIPVSGVSPDQLHLVVFHDEDVEIYFDGVLAYRAGGFVRNYELPEILPEARKLLKPGASILIAVHCHQTTGGQGIDVGLATIPPEFLAAQHREQCRQAALSTPGDPIAGGKLFANTERLACAKCHSVDGSSSRAGPDLFAAGDKFTRPDIVDAILEPSAKIEVGYSTTVVETHAGDTFVGIIKEASDDRIGIMDGEGKLHRIATADVRKQFIQNTSLMPQCLESALSPGEFADVVAYLASLRLPAVADAGRRGMPTQIPQLQPPARLIPIHTEANHFDHPCWIGQLPGQPEVFLICEHQTGKIWRLTTAAHGAVESKTLWGDFSREIQPGPAIGLLGLAFHPKFEQNHTYYIQHQFNVNGKLVTRISEKKAAPDFSRDSGQPSRTILEIPCSTDVHAGGNIAFGPDGFLYIGMGDTGPQGDPQGHGQNLALLLGKMLRIDVDHTEEGKAYAIPADNPFRSRSDVRPEIWAYGFREPWRFSFDSATNDLWVGDVGQDRIEEVDIVRRGENYGWNVYEGFDFFSSRYRTEGASYVPPVFAYDRRLGNSITGGFVFHQAGSAFDGVYVCGDFTSKCIWGLKQDDRKLTAAWRLCTAPQEISSIGQDQEGTILIVGYEGTIYRLDLSGTTPTAAVAHD
jgi:putative heme-binding domain-containing protein